MIRVTSVFAAAALAGTLVACAAPPPPAPGPMASTVPTPTQPPAPPGSSAGIDGVYRAPPEKAPGNSACGTTRFGYPIRVANGIASMQTVSQGRLEGPVGPNGSLTIQNGNASLSGQFGGGKFTGNYSVRSCNFTLNYSK